MWIITTSPVKLSEEMLLIHKKMLAFFFCLGTEATASDWLIEISLTRNCEL